MTTHKSGLPVRFTAILFIAFVILCLLAGVGVGHFILWVRYGR